MTAHRILIVDNDADLRASLKMGFERKGYAVSAVGSGPEGLTMAERDTPDLIVLDVMMDGMDGFEVCRRLRQSTDTHVARLPVLMLTAREAARDQTKALEECGADDYVVKPFDQNVLHARIQALLRRAVRPPFQQTGDGAVLGLTCSQNQPVHLTMSKGMQFLGITRGTLGIDPVEWGELARASNGSHWRVQAKSMGQRLWKEIFVGLPEILGTYQHEIGALKDDRRQLRLRFPSRQEFLRVPLEFVFGGSEGGREDYLVLQHPFARSIVDVPRNTLPICAELLDQIWAEQRPLRILAIASNVHGEGLPDVPGVDEEVRRLGEQVPRWFGASNGRRLRVEILELSTDRATYSRVEKELERCTYDIVHYAGHGIADPNPEKCGLPFWEGAKGTGGIKVLTTRRLGYLLERSRVALMYLSACEGISSAPRSAFIKHDFLGLADAITKAGVPALLGFRWPVSDQTAIAVAEEFYKSLANQGELDVAALDMRRALSSSNEEDHAWLSPILVVQR